MEGRVVVDVRKMPPPQRHIHIFDTFNSMAVGQIMELINDHDPKPLWYQISAEMPDMFEWKYIEEGPVDWKVEIKKTSNIGKSQSIENAMSDVQRHNFDPLPPVQSSRR